MHAHAPRYDGERFTSRVQVGSFAAMAKGDKRRLAQQMYVRNGMLQHEIAHLLVVSAKTISLWKNADGWEKQRAAFTTTKEQELSRIYSQLAELNTAIAARKEGARYPTPGEADTQTKMASTIAKLEGDAGLSGTINVFVEFTKWLRLAADLDTTKRFAELSDSYIKQLIAQ